jgi:hypothetical protein
MSVLTTVEKTSYDETVVKMGDTYSIFTSMQGQTTPLYSLTTTPTSIDGFTVHKDGNFMVSDLLAGTISPDKTGWYRISFIASLSFTSASTTRTLVFDLVNVTDATIVASTNINVPKDATIDGESLTAIMELTANKDYALQVSSSVNMDVTFDLINFSADLVGY